MKTLLALALSSLLTLSFSSAALAEAPKAPAAPVNKKCPVEGGDVDPSVSVTQEGKTVGFCCKGCDKEFKKDPQKYLKILAERNDDSSAKDAKQSADKSTEKAPKVVNKMCLVHAENPVDSTVTVEHNGKTYGFCCEDCLKSFNADPEKYIKKIEKK